MNGAAPVTASGVKPRRLVLHFDINKTIVMRDPSNNVNNSTLTVSVLISNASRYSLATCLPSSSGESSYPRRLTVSRNYSGHMSAIRSQR